MQASGSGHLRRFITTFSWLEHVIQQKVKIETGMTSSEVHYMHSTSQLSMQWCGKVRASWDNWRTGVGSRHQRNLHLHLHNHHQHGINIAIERGTKELLYLIQIIYAQLLARLW